MGHKFAQIAFTPKVREIQTAAGSRAGYAGMDTGEDYNHRLSDREAAFIQDRDSFYMASIGETGWPYLQHRGGPAGFLKVLDAATLGFADYSGNRQYVSTGNFTHNDRVALFFMDYPNRTRLKLLGRVQIIDLDDSETLAKLEDDDYRARVERGFIIRVEAFDWNCPQHITPRYSEAEARALIASDSLHRSSPDSTPDRTPNTTPDTRTAIGDAELALVISGVRQLSPRVRAYELRDPNGQDLPAVTAGSHLQLPVMLDGGQLVSRHYSIASNPARRDVYEIAVLLEEHGSGGSHAIHHSYQLGMTLQVAPPQNHFKLHPDHRPAILIAAGIGITPIKAMAQALSTRGTPLQLHYAGRSLNQMPYRDRLQRELGTRLSVYAGDAGERLDIAAIMVGAPSDALFYLCGPDRLIDAAIAIAKVGGIDPDRLRFERFQTRIAADAKPVRVELARSGGVVQVDPDQTILDAILATGVELPYSCQTGNCKSCAVTVLSGTAEHRDSALSDNERDQQQLMCPCVSRAQTDHLILDI